MTEKSQRQRRWMPILLIFSLGMNLLVAGLVLGTVLRFRGGPDGIPPGFGPALYRALPDADRKDLRGELADQHRRGAKKRSDDFRALGTALRAVPFDRKSVQVLLDEQARSNDQLQEAVQQQWLSRISTMTDQERAAYADRLEEVVKRRQDRRKRKD
ncbi:MAG: periplasmic heavy metal sensor [Ruegeria sp.]